MSYREIEAEMLRNSIRGAITAAAERIAISAAQRHDELDLVDADIRLAGNGWVRGRPPLSAMVKEIISCNAQLIRKGQPVWIL